MRLLILQQFLDQQFWIEIDCFGDLQKLEHVQPALAPFEFCYKRLWLGQPTCQGRLREAGGARIIGQARQSADGNVPLGTLTAPPISEAIIGATPHC